MASLRLDEGTQVDEFFYYFVRRLEGSKCFRLPSSVVLPPAALRGLDGMTGFGEHGQMGKNEQLFPSLSLWQSQPSFELQLGMSLAPSRGKGGKVAKGVVSPGDLGLKLQGWEPFPYLCSLPTGSASNCSIF